MARTRLQPLQAFDQLTSFELRDPELPRAIPMDAFRRNDRFIVQFDMPGVDPSSVTITHQRNMLQIRAERQPIRERGDEVSLSECPHGVLTRQLFLDESLDPRRLTARCDRGVVTLTIPIIRRATPEQIRLGDTKDVDRPIRGAAPGREAELAAPAVVPSGYLPNGNGQPPVPDASFHPRRLDHSPSGG